MTDWNKCIADANAQYRAGIERVERAHKRVASATGKLLQEVGSITGDITPSILENLEKKRQAIASAAGNPLRVVLPPLDTSITVRDDVQRVLHNDWALYQAALGAEKSRFSQMRDNMLKICDEITPLVLDLDGDGVEADALAHFDHAGDGWSELSRWASADDGVLVWDRNNDGVINDGSELFGNNTTLKNGKKAADGFAALAELDTNSDGAVDASDAAWANLRVLRWTDANKDGKMQDSERRLVTLSSLSIKSLGTSYSKSDHKDKSGNEHRLAGSYTKTDGSTAKMTDVWLVTNPSDTIYDDTGIPAHSVAIKALPDLAGRGRLYNLRDAMALDDAKDANGKSRLVAPFYEGTRTEKRSLREMVEAFVKVDDAGAPVLGKSARTALADKILLRWAGAEGVKAEVYWQPFYNATNPYMEFTSSEKLAAVEAVQGEQWLEGKIYRNPAYKTGQKISRGYLSHRERLYGELMLASHLKDLHAKVSTSLKKGAKKGSTDPDDYGLDFSGVEKLLTAEKDARRGELLRSLAAVYGSGGDVLAAVKRTAADWAYEYEYYAEYLERGVHGGNARLQNEFRGDCGCSGGLRDNVFQTTDGGADVLRGRGGDDIYHLGVGTGNDRIEEYWHNSDPDGGDGDVIKIAPGIGKERVTMSRSQRDLFVSLLDASGAVTDTLTVVDHYAYAAARVEKVLFEDGTVWSPNILVAVPMPFGRGTAGSDFYDAALNKRSMTAYGGKGSDVYMLGRGEDSNMIDEARYNLAGNKDVDAVRLKAGLTAADVRLTRTRGDLIIQVLSADGSRVSNTLVVKNHYLLGAAQIERVELSGGELLWGKTALASVVLSDIGAGDDVVTGMSGADVLSGGNGGNDTLRGGGGDDVYLFGRGSGKDVVVEAYQNFGSSGDVVRLAKGLSAGDVSISRNTHNLVINLNGVGDAATDTLTVQDYYVSGAAKVERVELSDGTLLWGAKDFAAVSWTPPPYTDSAKEIVGTDEDDALDGDKDTNDVFDADAGGDDVLYGYGGNDVYWLGKGTGNDTIAEPFDFLARGDAGDRIKLKAGIATSDVRLRRSNDGNHLYVELLDAEGAVTDSLKVDWHYFLASTKVEHVEFAGGTVWDADDLAAARIRGGTGADHLYGLGDTNDVFDSDAGGNDHLYGRGGDDVYMLGRGTGNDVIREHYGKASTGDAGDTIKLKSGIAAADVRLRRSDDGKHLYVELLDAEGAVTDSLQVENHYTKANAKVERVELSNGNLLWGADDLAMARIRGGSGADSLRGLDDTNDVFDADAGGNDQLHGRNGDDVYWLGRGTGNDVIREHSGNATGDAGDTIKLKSGITAADVRLRRSNDGEHLYVELRDAKGAVTDSLKVENHYTDASAKVERVELSSGKLLWGKATLSAAVLSDAGAGNDVVTGMWGADVLSGGNGGNDTLRGGGGDDVYLFGRGSGKDVVVEAYQNFGSEGDVVRLAQGVSAEDVSLSRNKYDLVINLKGAAGAVTDTLTVQDYYVSGAAKVERVELSDGKLLWGAKDFAAVSWTPPTYTDSAKEIIGTSGDDTGENSLFGLADTNDVFDSDAGGNDHLNGKSGDDVYWLGKGTGNDIIREHYGNATGDAGDTIKLKSGITATDVRLRRSKHGKHLYVELLDAEGAVTDSLKVEKHYTDASAKIERVELSNGNLLWGADDFAMARIHGGPGDETGWDSLFGLGSTNDVFDSDAGGNDHLNGYSGDDVYWLGKGTGHDVIYEHPYSSTGDAGDTIKLKSGITAADARLRRSKDGKHLYVELLDAEGAMTDSLKVENHYFDARAKVERVELSSGKLLWGAADFAAMRIRGGAGSDSIYGDDEGNDVFDSDAGGNDRLHGRGGDDLYWLGKGTGNDVIREHYGNATGDAGDTIKLKSGITAADVRLRRSKDGKHLYVELLDAKGAVTDSMKVENHYTDASAKVERVDLSSGNLLWRADDFALARIRGGTGADNLYGLSGANDVFDSDAGGNDRLHGRGGDDVYWLGRGTGNDVIREHSGNTSTGDAGDTIKLKSGITATDVRLRRNHGHLHVELLDAAGVVTDSLKVENHYTDASAKIERVELSSGKLLWNKTAFSSAALSDAGAGNDVVTGMSGADVLSGGNGGNDTLRGGGGDDVYLFGKGSGKDVVEEAYRNFGSGGDVVRLAKGLSASDVSLSRPDGKYDLVINLKGADGAVTDTLTVRDYYVSGAAKVERVELSDGSLLWGAKDFAAVSWTPPSYADSAKEIIGTSGDDTGWRNSLFGLADTNDVFDSDAGGEDHLNGKSGDDVYWLGKGTDNDVIYEYTYNSTGDAGDTIKLKSDITAADVRLRRSKDGKHLHVELLDEEGAVTDSLKVQNHYTDASAKIERVELSNGKLLWGADDLAVARIHGGPGDETGRWNSLFGLGSTNDVFDSDAGGNDHLNGKGGDDVYWLGRGTGNDVIREHYGNATGDAGDTIKLKSGIVAADVRLRRSNDGRSLLVELLDAEGAVTDSLKVQNHYTDANAKIERVELSSGKLLWGADDLAAARIHGGPGDESLSGLDGTNDVFDSDAGGNDSMYGRGGDDVYWLGKGTDHDVIYDYSSSATGDSDDKIKVKSGFEVTDVSLRRSGNDLVVQLLDDAGKGIDSLTVDWHYTSARSRVESIEVGAKVLRMADYQRLIEAIAVFNAGNSSHETLAAVHGEYWEDISASS